MRWIAMVSLTALAAACGGSSGSNDAGGSGDDSSPDGAEGTPGTAAQLVTSDNLPDCNEETDGMLFYVTDEENFQVCIDGSYEVIDLTGPPGEDGADGTNGTEGASGVDGADGSVWHSGSGVPASNLGALGDFYLDSNNGDVYQKLGSGWTFVVNLTGADGASTAGVWLTGHRGTTRRPGQGR